MTPVDWLSIAVYVWTAAGLGRLSLHLLRTQDRTWIDSPATCYLTGQLGLHLLMVATAYMHSRVSSMLPVVLSVGAAGGVMLANDMVQRLRREPMRAFEGVVAVLLFFIAFPTAWSTAHSVATVEWDARMLWMFHGKALFYGDGVTDAFFGDPQLWWSNLDYPILLPAQAAWSARIAGEWNSLACKAHLLATLVCWLAILHRVVLRLLIGNASRGDDAQHAPEQSTGDSTRLHSFSYLACWIFSLGLSITLLTLGAHTHAAPYDYVSGMADRHYSTPLLLAALATSPLIRPTPWLLIAVLLAYSANTKNEAAVYVLLLLASWSTVAAARGSLRLSTVNRERAAIALALLLGLAPLVAWKAYALSHPIPGGLGLGEQLGDLDQRVLLRLPTVTKHLLGRLHDAGGTWAGMAFVAVAMVGWRKRRQTLVSAHEAGVVLAAITVCGLLCVVFLLTPHDFVLHMNMAMARLVVLPTLLLGAATVLRMARIARIHPS